MKKLAIITTHLIQYNAPMFQLLRKRNKIAVKVFYTWGDTVLDNKYDPGFNKTIQWDIPLLDGYEYSFVKNISKHPGSHHFKGIDNPALNNEIEQWEADAILVYGWNFKSHFKAMRYFQGKIPVFFRGDSTLLNKQPFLKKIARKVFLQFIYRNIDKALYVGTLNKSYFENFGLKENQLVFAPHAVDNHRFSSSDGHAFQIANGRRAELGIPTDSIVILFAGKLEQVKNPVIILHAFKSMSTKNVHLVVAGDGLLEKELKTIAGDDKNIHFIPFQNQLAMPSLYRMADIFVLPSLSETWGLSVNEAMASGKAILISDTCGCAPDLVKNGVNGFTFESNNTIDLVTKMKHLVLHKDSLEAMGDQSRRIIGEWSFEKICEGIEQSLDT